jgi:hypothetical protein
MGSNSPEGSLPLSSIDFSSVYLDLGSFSTFLDSFSTVLDSFPTVSSSTFLDFSQPWVDPPSPSIFERDPIHSHPPEPQLPVTSRYDQSLSSSKSSRQRSKPQFSCDPCGKRFVQRQGLNRHRLEMHEHGHLCDFQWQRPYEYRRHLEKHHPDVDPDIILGKKPKLCMYCDVMWSHPDWYKDHLREHHPNLDPDAVLGKVPGSQRRDKIIARPYKTPAQLARSREAAV